MLTDLWYAIQLEKQHMKLFVLGNLSKKMKTKIYRVGLGRVPTATPMVGSASSFLNQNQKSSFDKRINAINDTSALIFMGDKKWFF